MGWLPNPFVKPSDTIKFNRGEFMIAYAEMKSAYSVLVVKLEELIKSGKLKTDSAVSVKRIQDQMRLVDGKLQEAMRNPEIEVDWEAVIAAVKLIIQLASVAL